MLSFPGYPNYKIASTLSENPGGLMGGLPNAPPVMATTLLPSPDKTKRH